ncbi:hypothetical protein [Streptomyces sp. NBC_01264]|uniref:hypothetical protein n=1 Tax=Streptomyces sp. NBC_01264 TaxID=2903804 RepID=UPI00224D7A06|nr:hypothetical protein [Streptomyces sp. NBC_01264]MCX4784077.1 hypothetical protein [Streptomyces sp. NBC_01264]
MNQLMKRFRYAALRAWLMLPRLRTLLIPTAGILATLGVLAPAAAADGPDDYKPGGIGDMMPSPFKPPGQGTLFESYSPDVYQLDKQLSDDLTGGDLIDGWLHGFGNMLMQILTLVGRAAVVVVGWCFNVVSLPEIEGAISKAIGAAAGPMMTTFLPTAVAVGGFIAWAKRSESSPLGQIAWVAASAAIATTFLVAPATWVKGVDNGRQLGASVAMSTIGAGLSGGESAMPFKTPEPKWSGNEKDNTVRRAGDAVWRTYVAVPWCIADLGSVKACQEWGDDVVKLGTDMDAREDYLAKTLDSETVGGEAVKWRQGHTPGGRIGVLLAGIISCVIFCALVLTLAFTTLASLIGALMLLVCGVAFATLWCIPGKPRQWGVQWFEMLLGLVMVSFTATMLLGSVMVVCVAMMSLLPSYGWLMVSALNICAAAMAFKVKGRLDGIVSAGGAQMAGRGVLSTVSRMASARRLRNAVGGRRGGGFGDMDRHPPTSTRNPRGYGDNSGNTSSGTGTGDVRTRPSRTIPPPPNYPPNVPGSGGPGVGPGRSGGPTGPAGLGPAGPSPRGAGPGGAGPGGSGPGSTGPGSTGPRATGPGRHTRPSTGPRPGPRRPAGPGRTGTGGTAGPYTVRPGAPRRTGVPPNSPPGAGQVIQGTVINRPANPSGARFRTYPPPAAPPRPTRTPGRTPGALPPAGGSRNGHPPRPRAGS